VLWVTVRADFTKARFPARMGRDGRLTIPKVEREVMEVEPGDILEVEIEVAEGEK